MSELAGSRKNKKNKKKGMDDVVNEAGVDSGKDDFMPTKKKRRHGKDKDKNKQDDLVDGTIEGSAGGPTKSKKRKKKTVDTDQGVTTTNQQTDFGTTNPTQKDLLWADEIPLSHEKFNDMDRAMWAKACITFVDGLARFHQSISSV